MVNNNNKGQTDTDVGSFLDLIMRRLIGGTLKAARAGRKLKYSLSNFYTSPTQLQIIYFHSDISQTSDLVLKMVQIQKT